MCSNEKKIILEVFIVKQQKKDKIKESFPQMHYWKYEESGLYQIKKILILDFRCYLMFFVCLFCIDIGGNLKPLKLKHSKRFCLIVTRMLGHTQR